MTKDERKKTIENSYDHLVGVLRHTPYIKDWEAAMKLATLIINEGYLLERHSTWAYDEYSDSMVCTNCYEKAPSNPEAPEEVILTDYCPYCGANMAQEEN